LAILTLSSPWLLRKDCPISIELESTGLQTKNQNIWWWGRSLEIFILFFFLSKAIAV